MRKGFAITIATDGESQTVRAEARLPGHRRTATQMFPSLRGKHTSSRGRDILVEVEHVGRVVELLERRQPRIRRWRVGIMDAPLTLVSKEVYVHPVGVGPQGLPDLLSAGTGRLSIG